MKRRTRPRRQRGIALITAILIVSLAVLAATAVITSGSLAIQRTTTLQETEKAWWYAIGVEAWVKTILERDAKMNKIDALNDIWAQPVDFLPVDQGFLRGQIIDEQGRFNLNNFAAQDQPTFIAWQETFARLFEELKLDPALARPISESIRDWVDADQNPTPYDGAEDTEYLQQAPPYRTADRLMQSVTELMAIKGMSKELYAALLPYIAVLPKAGTNININTAPELLLRALVGSPGAEFEAFMHEREKKPAETTTEFLTFFQATGSGAQGTFKPLAVASQYFQLRAEATIGTSRVAIYSLYFRPTQGTPVVLFRSTDSE